MDKVMRGIEVLKQVPELDYNDRGVINALIKLCNQASFASNVLQRGSDSSSIDTLTYVYKQCQNILGKVSPVEDLMKEMCSKEECNERDALLTLTYVNTVRELSHWCELSIEMSSDPKVFSPQ